MKTSHTLSGGISVLLLSAAFAGGAGCGKSEAAPSRAAKVEQVPVAGGPKAEAEHYVAEMTAPGLYKAGAEGVVVVTLLPKGAYHTNPQYPYKFKLGDPPQGVSYPKPMLVRADGSFEDKRGTFKVPFVAAKPGKVTVGGTFSLSVCNEASCIMDKVPLEVVVDVK